MPTVEFDHYSIALLMLRPDAPAMDDAQAEALQDAHLAFLADLHDSGDLLAVGPLLGEPDREIRGLSIFRVDSERTRELCEKDPAVVAGRFGVIVMPWMTPAGAMRFKHTRLPRSTEDVDD
jgi:uncharacterized protein